MPNKWLNLGSKDQQKEGANGGGGIGAAHLSPGMAGDTTLAPPRGDLLLLEDIYRTAGIMEPRMGYSITKVVEKLSNDHLRGLGDEVKRASVLMALNAAGVPLGDILQDASRGGKFCAADRDGTGDAAVCGAHEPEFEGSAAGERSVSKMADGDATRSVADFRSGDFVRAAGGVGIVERAGGGQGLVAKTA